MQNRNKGITLVALIITIVVMLILVAVSVNILIKSNLIGTAEKTVDKYNKVAEEEGNSGVIEINGKKYASAEDYLAKKEYIDSNIPGGTKVTEPTEYKVGDKTAIIPAGFTISGIDSERTIDGGLVIYLINDKTDEEISAINWEDETTVETLKQTYDQFVWIPITHEQINNMFICQAKTGSNGSCNIVAENGTAKCTTHNSTQMAGRLYATSLGENYYKKAYTEVYTANSGLREPDVVTGNSTGDGTSYVESSICLGYMSELTGDNTSYVSTAKFKETLQNEYNEIVALVYNAGGYYVGRYETSNITTTKGTAINIVAGTNSGIAGRIWYWMYAQQKAYAANKSLGNKVKSSMMLGTCHDQMLEFVNAKEKYDVTTKGYALHNRSYEDGPWQTAGLDYTDTTQYKDLSKNIYDLEGNVYEWTTEAYDTDRRVGRGRLLLPQLFC